MKEASIGENAALRRTSAGMRRGTEREPFGSNAVRLSWREWAVVVAAAALFVLGAPRLWMRAERFQPRPDFRIPYSLANDYWVFERLCRATSTETDAVFVVGDSAIWGHYVAQDETLSHDLAELTGRRFVNAGVEGLHPAALAGLVRYYGGALRGRRVLAQWNPLWIASPRRDLSAEKEFAFNHPELVPQFFPKIPCYRASFSTRVHRCLTRRLLFFAWVRHLRIRCFEGMDLASWTVEHPWRSPIAKARFDLPQDAPSPESDFQPWTARGVRKQDFDWVDLDASLQWRFFREALATLRRRGNRVFVLVGPFNEHMLTEAGLRRYKALRRAALAWLQAEGIPCLAAAPPPSELYADASHPLAKGYKMIARELAADPAFQRFLGAVGP